MIRLIYLLVGLLFLIDLTEAHSDSFDTQTSNLFAEKIQTGAIVDTVFCDADNTHFYALFVPSSYNESKQWPILYFFEPAARGKLPLTLYQKAAEKYGWVLACSYNSRNGPIDNNEKAFKKMSSDVESKLNINKNRVYVSGFSGGGRFSQYTAQKDPKIAGVISVAGPKGDGALFDITKFSTPYAGIVGTRDMNYLEHIRFQETLNEAKVPNSLFTYNAAHQWPPIEVYEKAIQWHIAQNDFTLNKDAGSDIVQQYLENITTELDTSTSLSITDKHRSYYSLQSNFGISNQFGVSSKIESLESDKAFKKAKKQELNILENEQNEQLELVKALSEFRKYHFQAGVNPDSAKYSMQWWRSQIGKFKSKAKQNDSKGLSNARKVDFLRGQVHNHVQRAKVLNKADLILSMHEINLLLYPNSTWFYWQHAILLAQYKGEKEAKTYLKQAKKINEGALDNIRQYPSFSGLKSRYPYLFN